MWVEVEMATTITQSVIGADVCMDLLGRGDGVGRGGATWGGAGYHCPCPCRIPIIPVCIAISPPPSLYHYHHSHLSTLSPFALPLLHPALFTSPSLSPGTVHHVIVRIVIIISFVSNIIITIALFSA